MKKINHDLLKTDYLDYPVLLFTEWGMLVERGTYSPLLDLARVSQTLSVLIQFAYLEGAVVIVKAAMTMDKAAIEKQGFEICDVKSLLGFGEQEHIYPVILKALHWMEWDIKTQYCGQCAQKLTEVEASPEKKCQSCGVSFFPKFSPAVMVLIKRDHKILLGRSPRFRPGVYSALAGFVNLGETAEEAARREVKEEVGLEISNLQYFGTQSWPFPDVFMVAFTAEYQQGEIEVDTNELEDAKWFDVRYLPKLPYLSSISRKLIDSVVDEIAAEQSKS